MAMSCKSGAKLGIFACVASLLVVFIFMVLFLRSEMRRCGMGCGVAS